MMSQKISLAAGLLMSLAGGTACAQSLASRVLVIYNSNPTYLADSLAVAQHYATERSIPSANLCPVAFANNEVVLLPEWTGTVRGVIRACLDAVGRSNIYYVVMSYNTPFLLTRTAPFGLVALDSHVADIWDAYGTSYFAAPAAYQRHFANAQSSGNVYPPFLNFAALRAQARGLILYSPFRLDADTAANARALVDRAKAVEAVGGLGQPPGKVYVDRRYPSLEFIGDFSYFAGDYDLERMALMAAQSGLTVVKDTNDAELGVAPAPLTAPDAILYSGWYQFNNYNDIFTWTPGAIGWHLDSASARHPRTGTSWATRALQRGITVTSGSVDEPSLEGLVHPDIVMRHLLQGGNVGDAFLRGTAYLRWMILNFGDPLYVPFPGGRAPFNNPVLTEDTLTANPIGLVTGSAQVTISLKNPAPAGGQVVQWNNNWTPAYVNRLPLTTTIPEGQRTSTVTLTVTNPVPTPADLIAVVINATYGSTSLQNSVFVTSRLRAIQTASSTITSGGTLSSAVVANELLKTATVVTLTSSNPSALSVPPTVTIPRGTLAVLFNATAGVVGASTPVTITAVTGAHSVTTIVTVVP